MTTQRSRFSLRNLIVSVAFVGVMAFGTVQAVATGGGSKAQAKGVCSSICKPECGSFGGTYKAGRCYCCG